jgi:hypothetical protein
MEDERMKEPVAISKSVVACRRDRSSGEMAG